MGSLVAAVALVVGCATGPAPVGTDGQPRDTGRDIPDEPALLEPKLADEPAPERFEVQFETTRGQFTVAVNRRLAPHGADRLYNLVRIGYYDGTAVHRVVDGYVAQFGLYGNPRVDLAWRNAEIPDDELEDSNRRGTVAFANRGADTRTTQLFVNLADNPQLDAEGFTPLGEVVEGMEVVDALYSGYGESPREHRILLEGNDYLRDEYENLDWIDDATILE